MVNVNSIIKRGNITLNKNQFRFCWDVETTGLEPFKDRILCITIMNVDTLAIQSFCQEDEQQLIKDFWDAVKNADMLIGFNSHTFDYPFVIQRSLFYAITVNKNIKQIDLRKESTGFWESYNKFAKGKLSDWAEKFGVPVDTEDGSKMPGLFLQGKWKEVQEHCEEDVKICKRLYDRCKICKVIT